MNQGLKSRWDAQEQFKQAAPPQPVSEREIPAAINMLQTSISVLLDVAERLSNRVVTVSNPKVFESKCDAPEVNLCPVASELRNFRRQVDSVSDQFQKILNDLEI